MAYRAFDDVRFAPVADEPTVDAAPAQHAPPFSDLELRVIVLSKSEAASSLEPPSRLSAFIAAIFGIKRANTLADPRLEALRRFTILTRTLGDRLADVEVNAFLQAGFDRMQLAWLRQRASAVFAR